MFMFMWKWKCLCENVHVYWSNKLTNVHVYWSNKLTNVHVYVKMFMFMWQMWSWKAFTLTYDIFRWRAIIDVNDPYAKNATPSSFSTFCLKVPFRLTNTWLWDKSVKGEKIVLWNRERERNIWRMKQI